MRDPPCSAAENETIRPGQRWVDRCRGENSSARAEIGCDRRPLGRGEARRLKIGRILAEPAKRSNRRFHKVEAVVSNRIRVSELWEPRRDQPARLPFSCRPERLWPHLARSVFPKVTASGVLHRQAVTKAASPPDESHHFRTRHPIATHNRIHAFQAAPFGGPRCGTISRIGFA